MEAFVVTVGLVDIGKPVITAVHGTVVVTDVRTGTAAAGREVGVMFRAGSGAEHVSNFIDTVVVFVVNACVRLQHGTESDGETVVIVKTVGLAEQVGKTNLCPAAGIAVKACIITEGRVIDHGDASGRSKVRLTDNVVIKHIIGCEVLSNKMVFQRFGFGIRGRRNIVRIFKKTVVFFCCDLNNRTVSGRQGVDVVLADIGVSPGCKIIAVGLCNVEISFGFACSICMFKFVNIHNQVAVVIKERVTAFQRNVIVRENGETAV